MKRWREGDRVKEGIRDVWIEKGVVNEEECGRGLSGCEM